MIVVNFEVAMVVHGLVVVVFVLIVGLLTLVLGFREIRLISLPELANCALTPCKKY